LLTAPVQALWDHDWPELARAQYCSFGAEHTARLALVTHAQCAMSLTIEFPKGCKGHPCGFGTIRHGRTHRSDALFPSADISLLTGSAKGAILPMCQQFEIVFDLLARGVVGSGFRSRLDTVVFMRY
jgi:hypothetical protein